jgi:predicted amidohydrolase
MKAALIQLNSSDDPAENLPVTCAYVDQAAAAGAQFILTPEVTNCVSASRTRQKDVLCHEPDDPSLAGLRERAKQHGVWMLIGSLALKTDDADGRFANRSFLIDPKGTITARYIQAGHDGGTGTNGSWRCRHDRLFRHSLSLPLPQLGPSRR